MPRCSNKLTKSRKGVGGRKRRGEVDAVSTPRPKLVSNPSKVSSSTKKIQFANYDGFTDTSSTVNEVIDVSILSQKLFENSLCKKCKKGGLKLKSNSHAGLASKLELFCGHCNFSETFFSSKEIEVPTSGKKMFEVNVRLVYGLRCAGKGLAAGRVICGIMNLPQPPTRFMMYYDVLKTVVENVANESMKKAVEEAVEENQLVAEDDESDPRDLSAGFDGTWQRRGFKSLNGVVTCTSIDSGKILDVEVLSKFCLCLDNTNHDANCAANYSGASGGMESVGAQRIVGRSIQKYGVRYVNYLGDGDSNSFASVVETKPYGDTEIKKLECVNHVMKRMGARLRRLKQDNKKLKLKDGKSLSGKNRLTDKVIDQLQSYYGKAIKENKHDLTKMKTSVWSIYFHKLSTDEKPHHGLCPKGKDSWCKYNKALAEEKTFKHKNSLPVAIMHAIKPPFRALAHPDLLKRCLNSSTQNVNESFNHVIWSRIPKKTFVTLKTLALGVYEAAACYNDGNVTRCKVLNSLGIVPGKRTVSVMQFLDSERIRRAEKAISDFARQARKQDKLRKRRLELQESEDNPEYESGMH